MSVRIIVGDCRETLRTLDENSVRCVVTSPPYYGLRDYGIPPTIWAGDAACEHTFGAQGKRHRGGPVGGNGELRTGDRSVVEAQDATRDIATGRFCSRCGAWLGCLGLEPTPEMFVSHIVDVFRCVHRVLANDGTCWINLGDSYTDGGRGKDTGSTLLGTRQNQAESRRVRTREGAKPFGLGAKQLIGMPWRVALALQADGWILRQDIIWSKPNPMPESVTDRPTKAHEYLFLFAKSSRYYYDAAAIAEPAVSAEEARWDPGTDGLGGDDRRTGRSTRRFGKSGNKERTFGGAEGDRPDDHLGRGIPWAGLTRNRRSVWTVPTAPYTGAHFATFPPDLIEPCIKAGTARGDTVLDPFGGAGTTGLVADRLGRDAVLCELNPTYATMARERIHSDAPLFADVEGA